MKRATLLVIALAMVAAIAFAHDDADDEFLNDAADVGSSVASSSSSSGNLAGDPLSATSTSSSSSSSSSSPEQLAKRVTDYPYDIAALGLVILYLIYYVIGRVQNSSRVKTFAETYRSSLLEQFQLVGAALGADEKTGFVRDSDSDFSAWCTGRKNIKGALVQLQLAKRQDLFATAMNFFSGASNSDRVIIDIAFDEDKAPDCVLAVLPTKEKKALKETHQDLSQCDTEKKGSGHGLEGFDILSEHTGALMDVLGGPKQAGSVLEILTREGSNHTQFFKGFHLTDLPDMAGFQVLSERLGSPRTLRITMLLPSDMTRIQSLFESVWSIVDAVANTHLRKDVRQAVDHHRDTLRAAIEKKRKDSKQDDEFAKKVAQERAEKKKELDRLDAMTPQERAREIEKQKRIAGLEQLKKMKEMNKKMTLNGGVK